MCYVAKRLWALASAYKRYATQYMPICTYNYYMHIINTYVSSYNLKPVQSSYAYYT